jgi:hypothetical protein
MTTRMPDGEGVSHAKRRISLAIAGSTVRRQPRVKSAA